MLETKTEETVAETKKSDDEAIPSDGGASDISNEDVSVPAVAAANTPSEPTSTVSEATPTPETTDTSS